jgi:hypothetical protein
MSKAIRGHWLENTITKTKKKVIEGWYFSFHCFVEVYVQPILLWSYCEMPPLVVQGDLWFRLVHNNTR